MRIPIFFWLIFGGFNLACGSLSAQTTNTPEQTTNVLILVRNAPLIDGTSFCCEAMVRAVNSLRHLGKDNALAVLRTYLRENGDDPGSNEKVLLLCRLLFVNPKGWSYPRLGAPDPEVDWKVAGQCPVFPLMLSHGVPFLLITGYNSSGYTSDTADKCVQLCNGFSLVPSDLAEAGYEDTARLLSKNEIIKSLYLDTNVLKYVDKMILDQAQCLDPVTRRGGVFRSSIEIKIGSGAN